MPASEPRIRLLPIIASAWRSAGAWRNRAPAATLRPAIVRAGSVSYARTSWRMNRMYAAAKQMTVRAISTTTWGHTTSRL
jgi:hypothetical protein